MASTLSVAVASGQRQFDIPLYPQGPPDSNGISASETDTDGFITNVTQPLLSVFLPGREKATGQMVVVFPGGGYMGVVWQNEGTGFSDWFNEQGIAVALLKYRMPNGHPEIPIRDALAALELVRANASEWGVDAGNIGVMGFSAGGHLAAMASTRFTGPGNRPDFAVLVYPLVSMTDGLGHADCRDLFLGGGFTEEDKVKYSGERQVGKDTPPMFIVTTAGDGIVDPRNSTAMFDALSSAGIPAALHIYPHGEHGWEFTSPGSTFPYGEELRLSLSRWLSGCGK